MAGFGGGFDTGSGFGGGGGGFIETTQTGGYGYGTAPAGGGISDVKRSDTLQPVTIAQLVNSLSDAADNKFVVNGQQLGMVTFVARIMACEPRVTMIQLRLDDCTGSISAVHMIDPEHNEYALQKREHIKEGAWVRIAGMMNSEDGEVQVQAIQVKLVEDFNELTYHKLEVARAFLGQTKPRPAAATGSGTTPVRNGMAKVGIGASPTPVPYGGYGGTGATGGAATAAAMDTGYGGGMAKDVLAVYNYLKQRYEPDNQDGVHVADIARNVPEAKDEGTVRRLLDALASEGHVYSTVDDDHYTYCQA